MTKPTDTPPDEVAGDRQTGPFFDRTTTTYKIAPIEISVTRNRESSHVPPPDEDGDCGCHDSSSAPPYAEMLDMLSQYMNKMSSASASPPAYPPAYPPPNLDMDK